MLAVTSCDDVILGNAEEGDPVQLQLDLYNSAPADSGNSVQADSIPSVEQIKIMLGKVTLGNPNQRMHSFVLDDSLFYLSGESESLYLGEKVIPTGSYKSLNIVIGDTTGGEVEDEHNFTIEITGSFNNKEFRVHSERTHNISLGFRPPLMVKKSSDSLNVITLYFDSSLWFTTDADNGILDPTDESNNSQIIENILLSAGLERNEQTGRGNRGGNRGNRGGNGNNRQGLKIEDAENVESGGDMTFNVELTSASENEVQVDYRTDNMSAKAGEDYTESSGTLTFEPGETKKSISVEILDDEIREPDERFAVLLSNPVNSDLINSAKRAKGTIINDDEKKNGNGNGNGKGDLPTLSIGDAEAAESDGSITFQVELSSAVEEAQVDYETTGNSAKAGDDFVSTSGTLVFEVGETVESVSVELLDDDISETDEKFTLVLSNPVNADIEKGGKRARGTILDDDEDEGDLPVLTISDATADESDGSINFPVDLSSPHDQEVQVDYSTSGQSAKAGEDFVSTEGTLTIAAGDTRQTISVEVLDDGEPESDEKFSVGLSNPVNAKLGNPKRATGTILKDESDENGGGEDLPVLSVSDTEGTEGDEITFSVALSFASDSEVEVDYATSDKSAKAGSDYVETSGTLTFEAGETEKTVSVELLEDDDSKDETFSFGLSNPVNAELDNKDNKASGTIRDND